MYSQTITLTFGECAENHVGMEKLGTMAKQGLSIATLESIQRQLGGELIRLDEVVNASTTLPPAAILAIPEGCRALGIDADRLYAEQEGLPVDTKAKMYGRVVNSRARYNLCFADYAQEPDYPNGKGRIIPFDEVPITQELRAKVQDLIGGETELKAEGNYYYNPKKCGIGYHGDAERRIVVAIRLGCTMPLCYQWYKDGEKVGDQVKLALEHGDMYIMSEKAVGTDWKNRKTYTLRHAAGCAKYVD